VFYSSEALRESMFAFYSNKLGCVGSILVSLIGTLLLLLLVLAVRSWS
jgi:hypothetical protein